MADSVTSLRAGVYGRESKGKTKSVDDQVALGLRLISDRGWQPAGTYDDGSSASRFATKSRDDWQQVLADIRGDKLDVLLLWEVARGSREPIDWFTFLNACRDNAVLIHVIGDDETFDVRKARHYKRLAEAGVDAAFTSDETSEKVHRGVRAAATNPEGATPHGRTPLGYVRVLKDPNGPVTRPDKTPWDEFYAQVPEPVAAARVRDVFERVRRGQPLVHVARETGFHRHTLRAMIRNVAYKGMREYDGEIYDGVWDGLMEEAEWTAANRILDAPNRKRDKPGLKKWLLSYIVLSGCSGAMHGSRARDGRAAKYHCLADGCTGIGQAELDEVVTQLVVARLSKDDARHLFVSDDKESMRAASEVEVLEKRLREWRQSGARGETSPGSLAVIERELEPQIDAARARLASTSVPGTLADLVTATDVRAAWDTTPLAGRREVIQTLFSELRIGRPEGRPLGRWSTDDDRLDAASRRLVFTWRGGKPTKLM